MPRFFTRFSSATLAFIFAFSSLQFSAENLLDRIYLSTVHAEFGEEAQSESDPTTSTETTTSNSAGGGGDNGTNKTSNSTYFSTLKAKQSELTAQHMRGYQSLYEMQAELFAECVAKLKNWDGTLTEPEKGWPDGAETDLDKICAEEFTDMNKQGPQRLLLPDATTEQTDGNNLENLWWDSVIEYWFGVYDEEGTSDGGLLPPLKQSYTESLRSITAPVADSANADLKKALEGWYGRANSLGGEAFLWHYLTKKSLHAVPFQQGIVTISNCPNLSSPIFANQVCVDQEWKQGKERLTNQRDQLIQLIDDLKTDGKLTETTKNLIAWYAVDDADMLEAYDLKEIDANRNALQLDIQKLSFLVSLLKQLAKYSGTVAYQLDLSENTTGGMGIYGNFSSTNAGVDIAQITNLSGKENLTLSQTISKLSNIMLIIALAIMIPVIVYAGFLMVLSGVDYDQHEKGREILWKVLPWAVWACACRFLIAAWIHVLTEAFRPIASF